MFSKRNTAKDLTANEKEIAKKILTGRAGFDTSTGKGDTGAVDTATALERSTTSFMVLVTAIGAVAHKTLSVGKRRLSNPREIAFAKNHLTSFLELFDPHIDADDTDETKATNWAKVRVNVLAASFATREDFGMSLSATLISTSMNADFMTYVCHFVVLSTARM